MPTNFRMLRQLVGKLECYGEPEDMSEHLIQVQFFGGFFCFNLNTVYYGYVKCLQNFRTPRALVGKLESYGEDVGEHLIEVQFFDRFFCF
jgi:hypothetical protein